MSRPKLKYFIQCDEVRNENGKFSAFGIFDTIFSFIFPANHKRFFLLAGFSGERGDHKLELQVSGPDGRILGNTGGELRLESEDMVANVIFEFATFPLPTEGRYTLSLFMDGDFLVEHFFTAKPPFPRRQRTREEIIALLNQPEVIRSANADVECNRCRTNYKFQLQLDPEAPVDEGYERLPEGQLLRCGKCGNEIPLGQVRQNLENIVGIPRQWLSPQGGGGVRTGHQQGELGPSELE
jgi:hypothetical protein